MKLWSDNHFRKKKIEKFQTEVHFDTLQREYLKCITLDPVESTMH